MVKKHKKLSDLVDVVKRLRNPKNGCPWDIQQTSKSLAKYTLEEAYEVIEAIESNNYRELEGELGDLLLQVIYHSIIAAEKKKFSIEDVLDTIVKKMKNIIISQQFSCNRSILHCINLHNGIEHTKGTTCLLYTSPSPRD